MIRGRELILSSYFLRFIIISFGEKEVLSLARKKTLKLDQLLAEDKSFDKNIPVVINDKITLYHSKSIGQDTIDAIFNELHTTVEFAKTQNEQFPSTYEQVVKYLDFLIFKYFSNLQEVLEGEDYYVHMESYIKSYQKGWMIKVLNNIEVEELGKVYERFSELIETGAKLEKYALEHREILLNTLQNDVIKNKFQGMN